MRRSRGAESVLGLAVVVALAGAFLAVRHRQAATATPAGDGAGAAASPASDVPDVSSADAILDGGDVRIRVSAGPRPLLAFAPNRFRFRAEHRGVLVTLGDAAVSFAMAMPMGDHRYRLVTAADGGQEAEAVLPLCPSGERRWFGRLDFTHAGSARSVRFAFDLTAPGSSPAATAERP